MYYLVHLFDRKCKLHEGYIVTVRYSISAEIGILITHYQFIIIKAQCEKRVSLKKK